MESLWKVSKFIKFSDASDWSRAKSLKRLETFCSSKRTRQRRKLSALFSLVSLYPVPTTNFSPSLTHFKMVRKSLKLSTNFPQTFHSFSCFVILDFRGVHTCFEIQNTRLLLILHSGVAVRSIYPPKHPPTGTYRPRRRRRKLIIASNQTGRVRPQLLSLTLGA